MTQRRRTTQSDRGQVLPIFAIFLVALLAMAALAIDVSSVLSARRFYGSVADAAALAGGQDLQTGTTRTVSAANRTAARTHALDRIASLLGVSTAGCDPTADFSACMAGGFRIGIKTPSPTCVTCSPTRSIQVSVGNPVFGLSFGGLVGRRTFDVSVTSVAGLTYGRSFTIVTLRPPKKLGSTFDIKDIRIDGGSIVNVTRGDVGSNSNMEYAGVGSQLILNPDYQMFYYPSPPSPAPLWGADPPAETLKTLIADPNYRYPDMTGAPVYDDARASEYLTLPNVGRADTDAACQDEAAKLDTATYAFMSTQAPSTIYCYSPGVYDSTNNNAQIVVGSSDVAILMPGAYYLRKGLDVSGRIVGGYEPNEKGVALMFDECLNTCIFSGNNALTIALNVGTKFPPGTSGVAATAAVDWAGLKVETSGPSSPTPPLPLTLLVTKDPGCTVPTSPPFVEPGPCDSLKNKTINIAGGGSLTLEGVQYMPTDNVAISGGSAGYGQVGQIIAWTLFYAGGTHINQEGPADEGVGILRLDAACTAPTTPCNS